MLLPLHHPTGIIKDSISLKNHMAQWYVLFSHGVLSHLDYKHITWTYSYELNRVENPENSMKQPNAVFSLETN